MVKSTKIKRLPPVEELHKIKINESSYFEGQKITFKKSVKYQDHSFKRDSVWEIRKVDPSSVRLHDLMTRKNWIGVSVENTELNDWISRGKVK